MELITNILRHSSLDDTVFCQGDYSVKLDDGTARPATEQEAIDLKRYKIRMVTEQEYKELHGE